ncbi:MAG: MarR family transcriptional regulator [Pigmentiphaga sp.]
MATTRKTKEKPLLNASASNSQMEQLDQHPGHLFRRAQQISTSVFYDILGPDVTPIQFAMMNAIKQNPGVDQVTLASLVALDTSTTAATAVRLEEKGLIIRELEIVLRRQRKLYLTKLGERALATLTPGLEEMRARLFSNMSAREQEQLIRLLHKFVAVNNEFSRAPMGGVSKPPRQKK